MNIASIGLLKARVIGNMFDNCLRYLDIFHNCSDNIKTLA